MAPVAVNRHHRVGNRSDEVGGDMVSGVGRGGQTVGGLGFIEIGRREDEGSGFR